MKRGLISSCCLGLIVAGGLVSMAIAGSEPAKPAAGGAPPAMSPAMMEAFQRMEQYGALNENHGYLKQLEGEWVVASKWYMPDGGPAVENTFNSTAKMAFDGKFIIEKITGNVTMAEGMPPQAFNGMSIIGYDNHRKQFSSLWMDNFMTGMMTEFGSASEGGKVFTFEGENYCCMNDKICKSKSIMTIVDANTRTFEMWGPGLDGKVYKAMEMTYTRKK